MGLANPNAATSSTNTLRIQIPKSCNTHPRHNHAPWPVPDNGTAATPAKNRPKCGPATCEGPGPNPRKWPGTWPNGRQPSGLRRLEILIRECGAGRHLDYDLP